MVHFTEGSTTANESFPAPARVPGATNTHPNIKMEMKGSPLPQSAFTRERIWVDDLPYTSILFLAGGTCPVLSLLLFRSKHTSPIPTLLAHEISHISPAQGWGIKSEAAWATK
jgi:hypothetical protein